MSGQSNDRSTRSPEDRRNVYRDLRVRNERRTTVARMLDSRRLRQIERVIQTSRERKFGGPR